MGQDSRWGLLVRACAPSGLASVPFQQVVLGKQVSTEKNEQQKLKESNLSLLTEKRIE